MQSQSPGDLGISTNTQSNSINRDKRIDLSFDDDRLTTTEPPEVIFTSTELLQLYQPLLCDPKVCAIQLNHGFFNIVDTSSFADLSEKPWYAEYREGLGLFYACYKPWGLRKAYIHREIAELAGSDFDMIDHVNGDTLDNRLQNLVKTSSSLNVLKADRRGPNATGFKGIQMRGTKFRARFTYEGKTYVTKAFGTPGEAVEAKRKMMALICPEVQELSVEQSERLALLRNVIKQMREGKLKLSFHWVRPLAIG